MKTFTISLLAAALLGVAPAASATDLTDVEPGTLATLLGDDTDQISSLTVSGVIDARDLVVIAGLPDLADLNLADARIVSFIPDRQFPLMEGEFADDYLPQGIFFGKHLTSLQLPAGLKSIGNHALAGNNFEQLQLPATLTSIGDYALYDCDALTSIAMPEAVTSLGAYSLAGCDLLASVDMSQAAALRQIGEYAFRNDAALSDLILPQNLTEIGTGAFAGCTELTAVELPSSLKTVGEQAFTHTGLSKAELPSSVKTIGDFAFSRNEALEEASFPADATLGDGVFYYSPSLAQVSAEGLASLPDFTFAGNSALDFAGTEAFADLTDIGRYALLDHQATTLVLGPSLTYLDDGALEGMTSLSEINAEALGDRVPALGEKVFAGINQKDVTLTVAEFTGDAWKAADQWKEFRLNELSGIGSTVADASDSIRAWFEGNLLQISAPEEIESVAVYQTGGAKLFHVQPYERRATVDTSDFTDRMYIVEVVAGPDRRVLKLLR